MPYYHGGKLDGGNRGTLYLTHDIRYARLHAGQHGGVVWQLLPEYERLLEPSGQFWKMYFDGEARQIREQFGDVKRMFREVS